MTSKKETAHHRRERVTGRTIKVKKSISQKRRLINRIYLGFMRGTMLTSLITLVVGILAIEAHPLAGTITAIISGVWFGLMGMLNPTDPTFTGR